MKRTFIAVKVVPDQALLEMISSVRLEMQRDRVKWTGTNQIHVTLSFLGDTPDEKILQVSAMLGEICSETNRFSISISGLGVFKSLNDPRVIWTGIERSPEFESLFIKIRTGLEKLNFPGEDSAFKPHLTLGRIKQVNDREKLGKLISDYSGKVFQVVNVTDVVYYESILQPTGPVYKPLKISELRTS